MRCWWMVGGAALAAACGSSGTGGSPDAFIETNVTVTTFVYGSLRGGMPVWFYEQDGTLDGMVISDDAGQARAKIGDGASATLDMRGLGPAYGMQSLLGLAPGGNSELGDPLGFIINTHYLAVSFTSHAGVSNYRARCDCDYCSSVIVSGSPAMLYFDDACIGRTAQITVVDDSDGTAFTTPVTAALDDGTSVTAGAWSAATAGSVSIGNVGESSYYIDRSDWAGEISGSGQLAGGGPYALPVRPLAPQMLSVTVTAAPTMECPHFPGLAPAYRAMRKPIATDQLAVTIDGNADLLPPLTATWNRTDGKIALSGGAGADVVRIAIELGGGARWELVGPPQPLVQLPPIQGVVVPPMVDCNVTLTADVIDLPDITSWSDLQPYAWARSRLGGNAPYRASTALLP